MLEALVKIALLTGGLMTAAAYFVLLERRMAHRAQSRRHSAHEHPPVGSWTAAGRRFEVHS
jgi:hypothetical protein